MGVSLSPSPRRGCGGETTRSACGAVSPMRTWRVRSGRRRLLVLEAPWVWPKLPRHPRPLLLFPCSSSSFRMDPSRSRWLDWGAALVGVGAPQNKRQSREHKRATTLRVISVDPPSPENHLNIPFEKNRITSLFHMVAFITRSQSDLQITMLNKKMLLDSKSGICIY